ncbi:MAG: glycoside hydrolase family 30 protein [Acidobacteriota bacterium]
MKPFFRHTVISLCLVATLVSCKSDSDNGTGSGSQQSSYEFWLSKPDKSAMFQKQAVSQTINAGNPTVIEVNEQETYQTIDGFGCALTGGSAKLLSLMSAGARQALLKELFATDGANIGISYLRISIGASDLDDHVFSYDDLPSGSTDTAMAHFSLDPDRTMLIPVLKEILAINPTIKILGSPWSAPVWMKTNKNSVGGSLLPQYYAAYAKYFVKYIQEMKKEGIRIDAITVQNEPLHGGNNPSMVMQASEQASFIKNNLGPAFAANAIDTKIIIYDHNADRTDYPITVMNDPGAKKYIDGSAFHLYGGSINDLAKVQAAHPDRNLYFTEQWIGGPGNFSNDLGWHIKNLFIGGTMNGCKTVLEWNLASDPGYSIHTDGGCTECLGAVTLAGDAVIRNSAYYILAHAAKFIRPNAVRIGSTMPGTLLNVVFKNADGRKAALVLNDGSATQVFKIKDGAKEIVTALSAGAVGTYVW